MLESKAVEVGRGSAEKASKQADIQRSIALRRRLIQLGLQGSASPSSQVRLLNCFKKLVICEQGQGRYAAM